MNLARLFLACLLLSFATLSIAQNNAVDKDNREVLRMGLYPPDILMRQQQALDITTEQRKAIAALVRDFQGTVTELQWAMPNEQQKLKKMLSSTDIDSEPALAQAEKVLQMESEFKLAHFELLIAIKNELTTDQIDTLDKAIKRRLPQRD